MSTPLTMIIDVETTGFPNRKGFNQFHDPSQLQHYDNARIVEVGWWLVDKDFNIATKYSAIVYPDHFDPEQGGAFKVHGITKTLALDQGVDIKDLLNYFLSQLKKCDLFVSHNIAFDQPIMASELYRAGFDEGAKALMNMTTFCTMLEGQAFLNVRKAPRLAELYKHFTGDDIVNAHRVDADIDACYECFKGLLKEHQLNEV